jgi:hypothetical protein
MKSIMFAAIGGLQEIAGFWKCFIPSLEGPVSVKNTRGFGKNSGSSQLAFAPGTRLKRFTTEGIAYCVFMGSEQLNLKKNRR